MGWDSFTEAAIRALIDRTDGLILVLWGNHAQTLVKKLGPSLDTSRVKVISSAHPSPLSAYRGFFGSKPFSAINAALVGFGKSPINWNL
jgi:uracil-DNA glycosylase